MRDDIIKELQSIIDTQMKEHWEIHKEKTPISLNSYMMRMVDEAYILGRADVIHEQIQETDRELQVSKRGSCC